MKNLMIKIVTLWLLLLIPTIPIQAKTVDKKQALQVANNWITFIIHNKGHWSGSADARVAEIQELKRDKRVLGYFCRVEPQGYIVVSLLKQMSPVTDFSYDSDLDPELDEGMAKLIKDCIERMHEGIEKQAGPVESATTKQLEEILSANYTDNWSQLEKDSAVFKSELETGVITMNYQEGEELLTSRWHQFSPYNLYCPTPPVGSGCQEKNCCVGCVGLSASEILRYWDWPPYGTIPPYNNQYAWWFMPDMAYENSPTWEKVAVAELCLEVADAIQSEYCIAGGCGTSSNFTNVKNAIENYFHYANSSSEILRANYDEATWFNIIKQQLNMNRPVQYAIPGHAIVVDGWMEEYPGPERFVHIVYGWRNAANTGWHRLDDIPGEKPAISMLINIVPAPALGSSISGVYSIPSFPYRYFDRDCSATYAVFQAGHQIQFLHNITVRGSAYNSESRITFYGSPSLNTRLFSRGDPSKGVSIYKGAVLLKTNGGIKFY